MICVDICIFQLYSKMKVEINEKELKISIDSIERDKSDFPIIQFISLFDHRHHRFKRGIRRRWRTKERRVRRAQ